MFHILIFRCQLKLLPQFCLKNVERPGLLPPSGRFLGAVVSKFLYALPQVKLAFKPSPHCASNCAQLRLTAPNLLDAVRRN